MSANVTINPEALQTFYDLAFRKMMRAGNYLADRVRANISQPGPSASAPGEYPHQQSGELLNSVYVVSDRGNLSIDVVADAPHADAVEKARPFMERTFIEELDEVARIATGG